MRSRVPVLLDQPILLWLAAAVILLATWALLRPRARRGTNQLDAVSHRAVSWQRRPVLNGGESLVYASACTVLEQLEPSWRIWPQVSLGEVVGTEGRSPADREAYRWINSKRADFLIVDATGWPLAVIEYQGRGHYDGNAAERDAVKRTVLGRAGIQYIEVPAEMSRRRRQLEAHLRAELKGLPAF